MKLTLTGACCLVTLWFAAGCATVARVANLDDSSCRESLARAIGGILQSEGETAETADALAARTVRGIERADLGPRPFLVAAPSGTDYSFFIQLKGSRCLLRLYGRQKGFVSYTNNLTYIATRELPPCHCTE